MIIANAQLGAGYKFQMLFRLPVCMKNGFHPRESGFFSDLLLLCPVLRVCDSLQVLVR